MSYRILSWNVNGIRAVEKKGFLGWLAKENPYILAVQETKAAEAVLNGALREPLGYRSYWSEAARKGYSGVAVFCQEEPLRIEYGFGKERFDTEGRTLILEYPHFIFFNIYFPNGKKDAERLRFKLDFYQEFLHVLEKTKEKGKAIIACGDFNTAHKEIDLERPKVNSTVSGFLPEERAWIDKFIKWGMADTFRAFHPGPAHYTWWDMKSAARSRNVGWRIDYFFVDRDSMSHVTDAFILKDVQGSDHCPIGIKLKF